MARIGELLTTLLRQRTPDGDPLSDAVLLERFARGRDQAAFELLVWRHGPMVLAACRRVLRDSHAAEDAFQAAFLVLARKAGGVRGSAAGWLHRVALRVCLRMKRRLSPVSLDAEPMASPNPDAVEAAEQSAILDEEVARLPEWLRLPVILCHLQGHTTDHAAAALGIPRGTVLSRLANARKRLAVRLTARGVAPVLAVAAVTELSADAGRVVAEEAAVFALGKSAHSVPVQLALEVLSMTKRSGVAVAAGVLVLVAGLGTGIGFVTAQGQGQKPTPTAAQKDPPPAEKTRKEQVTAALARADAEYANRVKLGGGDDLEALRQRYQNAQAQLSHTGGVLHQIEQNLVTERRQQAEAQAKLEAARKAAVPGDVLEEAVKSHPKVVEVQKRLTAKEDELRTSKLPADDAERKKLDDERITVFRELQAAQKQAGPEVEAYLRAPGVVAVQKTVDVLDGRVRQSEKQAEEFRQAVKQLDAEMTELKAKIAKLEPFAEELMWLKEIRKRLKRELFELEFGLIEPNDAKGDVKK